MLRHAPAAGCRVPCTWPPAIAIVIKTRALGNSSKMAETMYLQYLSILGRDAPMKLLYIILVSSMTLGLSNEVYQHQIMKLRPIQRIGPTFALFSHNCIVLGIS